MSHSLHWRLWFRRVGEYHQALHDHLQRLFATVIWIFNFSDGVLERHICSSDLEI